MIPKLNHKPLPTFEQWLQNSTGYVLPGSDVMISDDTELCGWYSNSSGVSDIKGNTSLVAGDMLQIPIGAYKVGDHNSEYILLVSTTEPELHRYYVKRYDFEEVKFRIKA